MMAPSGELDFPFAIDARGRSARTDIDDHIRDMIRLVLFTVPGERVNRPDFGCGVTQLVFAPNLDVLAAATEQLILGALLRWLDSVIVPESVDVEPEDAILTVTVIYSRRDTGERRQDVFSQAISP